VNTSSIADLSPRNSPNNVLDISDLLICLVNKIKTPTPTVYEKIVGDIDSDGILGVRDILFLRRNLGC